MLTAERLRELLQYDPVTGVFTQRLNRRGVKAGEIAGSTRPDGRRKIEVDGREYKEHRLAWFYVYGGWPKGRLDHKDGEPAHNWIDNLRPATNSQNQANRRVTNKHGLKGISLTNGKWIAQILKDGKRHYLGCFDTPEAAHAAYVEAAKRLHGEFARAA